MIKTIEVKAYKTPEGLPTCQTHEGKCQFLIEGRGVWYNNCRLSKGNEWLKVEFGSLQPHENCIVWKGSK